jgi:hypothetical protein
MASIYRKSLDPGAREIRLLALEPGRHGDPLRGSLAVCSLLPKPFYNALSYVWGDTADLGQIAINRDPLRITRNLEIALQHIRDADESLVLWIDAICIDQSNVSERNAQVAMMGDIFASASDVLIWIGEADEYSDRAFEAIHQWWWEPEFVDGEAERIVWQFLGNVSTRPWFSRVWVIQELSLASADPWVLCGKRRERWSEILKIWNTVAPDYFEETSIRRPLEEVVGMNGPMMKIDTLDVVRKDLVEARSMDLRRLLIISRTSLASEPRDKVYALLGMLSPGERAAFAVDYHEPVAVVYARAMRLIFMDGDGPVLLAEMPLFRGTLTFTGMPSWVVELTTPTAKLNNLLVGTISRPHAPVTASGCMAEVNNGVVLDDLQTLRVDAVVVDEIYDNLLLPEDESEYVGSDLLASLVELTKLAMDRRHKNTTLAPCYERYKSGEPLWKVLVADRECGSIWDAAPVTYENAFNELVHSTGNVDPALVSEYRDCLKEHLPGQSFFTTNAGLIGVGTAGVLKGDVVTLWFGSPAPFVVRPTKPSMTDACCSLIGPGYVSGIMAGAIVDELYCKGMLDSTTLFVV